MPDILAYTTTYFTDPYKWRLLRESAIWCRVDLKTYGSGIDPGLIQRKVIDMIAFLEKQTAEYVLYVDSFDSFFVYWDPERALEILESTDMPAIFCAERNCHPYAHLKQEYPESFSPWNYLNAGGFLGEREAILDCLLELKQMDDSDDQGRWTRLYLGDRGHLNIDRGCRLFQSLFLNEPGDVEVIDGRVRNRITAGKPMIIHANGMAPGLEELYHKIHG